MFRVLSYLYSDQSFEIFLINVIITELLWSLTFENLFSFPVLSPNYVPFLFSVFLINHLGQSGIQARKLGTQNGEENGSSLNIILLSGKCGPFLGSPEVKWYKGREQITDSEDFRYENDGDTYRLVIAEVFPEDSGMYKCVAENEAGTASSSFTVFVEGTIEKM